MENSSLYENVRKIPQAVDDLAYSLSASTFFILTAMNGSHIIDVAMAMVVANRLPGDSVSLHIVGPSSSAKTEVARSLLKYSHAYHLSQVTPKLFWSGYIEPGKKAGEDNKSLLKRLEKEKSGYNLSRQS